MGQPGFKIGRRSVEALGASERSPRGTRHADRDLPGFFLMAYPKRVSFFVRYRANGRRRTVKIGDYPATMPEDARKAALSILGAASKGEDEAQKRKDARETATASTKRITFAARGETYFAEATRRLKAPGQGPPFLKIGGAAGDARPVEEVDRKSVV